MFSYCQIDEENIDELFTPVTPAIKKKKKKSGAHKLLRKLKKKQTRKVSEIPPNQIIIRHVAMETVSPPSNDRKGYQNIFDFEQREFPQVRKCESFSRVPKKPKVRVSRFVGTVGELHCTHNTRTHTARMGCMHIVHCIGAHVRLLCIALFMNMPLEQHCT